MRSLFAVGPILGVLALATPAAHAACSAPVASGNTRTVTCPAGTVETVGVPAHVGGVTLEVIGGDGGSAVFPTFVGSGGGGAGTLTAAGPLSLDVVVGTKGVSTTLGGAGGTPGGGAGAGAGAGGTGGGGGGGGLSSITLGATPLIIAGGGGGAGSSSQYGKGGSGGGGATSFAPDGQPAGLCNSPGSCLFPGALGGTQTAGGAGEPPGLAGAAGTGGDAGTATGGAGGGAGCFGGGGGGTTRNGTGDGGGGGGGGSTCIDPSITDVTYPLGPGGDGRVVIEYSVPVAAQLTSASPARFTGGTRFTYAITSTGHPAATISLDPPGTLPPGLTFAPDPPGSGTATISGTPTGPPGSLQVTVRASNGTAPDATQALTIDVLGTPPAITSGASAAFTIGSAGSHAITSSGYPAATISLDAPATLPAGLTFTPGTAGAATIAGTPAGPAGPVSVTVRASNGQAPDATQTLTMDVTTSATPTPTPTPGTIIASVGGGFVSVPPGTQPVAPTATGVAVSLGCAGATGTTCSGKVAVSVRVRKRGTKIVGVLAKVVKTKVGSASYTIAAGRFKTVKVKLNRTGRRLLKRFRRLTVRVNVTVTTTQGQRQLVSKKVRLRSR